ncbi:hypothetical protein H6F86_01840 [Phormidium sp. FACHB-592]|uniref:Uncharacterized protein n=1 Tax=Stenomitos frigidus AS-A4 TaxID=2933935 RepID=A0ABV0KM17_9CYAN|nr:hypothetical protein [Phormidium sp. FACHB-592]MBD2072647.1 hypothetical protein [Phormidium sp. FACHB-592]
MCRSTEAQASGVKRTVHAVSSDRDTTQIESGRCHKTGKPWNKREYVSAKNDPQIEFEGMPEG